MRPWPQVPVENPIRISVRPYHCVRRVDAESRLTGNSAENLRIKGRDRAICSPQVVVERRHARRGLSSKLSDDSTFVIYAPARG